VLLSFDRATRQSHARPRRETGYCPATRCCRTTRRPADGGDGPPTSAGSAPATSLRPGRSAGRRHNDQMCVISRHNIKPSRTRSASVLSSPAREAQRKRRRGSSTATENGADGLPRTRWPHRGRHSRATKTVTGAPNALRVAAQRFDTTCRPGPPRSTAKSRRRCELERGDE